MSPTARSARIPDVFLDALRNQITLSDLVGRSVKLKCEGCEMVGLCPFHEESTPSFSVNNRKAIYHCFDCGAHGDCIAFAQHVYKMTFR